MGWPGAAPRAARHRSGAPGLDQLTGGRREALIWIAHRECHSMSWNITGYHRTRIPAVNVSVGIELRPITKNVKVCELSGRVTLVLRFAALTFD
jgi:hypothetical protein